MKHTFGIACTANATRQNMSYLSMSVNFEKVRKHFDSVALIYIIRGENVCVCVCLKGSSVSIVYICSICLYCPAHTAPGSIVKWISTHAQIVQLAFLSLLCFMQHLQED